MSDMHDYPIVLSHGIARFDFLRNSLLKRLRLFLADINFNSDRTHYFRKIATHLRRHGFDTYHTSVSFASSVERRAKELRQEILRILNESGRSKVHIIGHSMGGLDSRHMIVHEDMAERVASLTTIGTPHLGTSFADWGLKHGGHELISALQEIVDLEGFLTLTLAERRAFNESVEKLEAANTVAYRTYAGSQEQALVFSLLKLSWQIIHDREGANDGLVSITSQRWTSTLTGENGTTKAVKQYDFPVPVDHLNQIGWWDVDELSRTKWWQVNAFKERNEFEAAVRDIYLTIAREVTGRG